MPFSATIWLLVLLISMATSDLIQNGGFESLSHWDCWSPVHCALTTTKHSGNHAVKVSGRQEQWQGPSQYIQVKAGHVYHVSGYVKLLNDQGHGQTVQMTLDYHFTDDSHSYAPVATQSGVRVTDGWVHLAGRFTVPNKALMNTRVYFEGPSSSVNFVVDDASVTEVGGTQSWRNAADHAIDQLRKSDIHIRVTTSSNVNKADVQINVLQKKKLFPFGTAVNAQKYNHNVAGGKYQAFIHNHFNWAVPENALKWYAIEPSKGHKVFQPALDMIHSLRRHGVKVRGHNLIWSVGQYVQHWVQQLSGDDLRRAVRHHIQETMNVTRGLLEHWDVNNENLHGQWFQDKLHDPSYNVQMFQIAHHADPAMKLFLNEYNVVASGGLTNAYLAQAQQFKAANVGLYGVGVQCHFGNEQAPNPDAIKQHLDTLAQAGLPIWVTELDVMSQDENKRADFLETALRAMYGHPAVEGILLWGFWDQAHWRGEKASLVKGDNLQLTVAGHRFLDLLENQWMTDETHVLSRSGDYFTVRGFHGNYEVHVIYQGRDLGNLKKTFTLGAEAHTVNINVHV